MINKRKMCSLFLCMAMMLSLFSISPLAAKADSGTLIKVETVDADPGDTVTVDVTISQNPGVLGGTLTLTYDSTLTLTNISNGAAFSKLTMSLPGILSSGCKVLWDAISDTANSDGVIMTLTFTVAEDAACGKIHNISVYVNDLVDGNIDSVESSVVSGGVRVNGSSAHIHNLTHVTAVAATSEAAGNIEYWCCAGCGRYFKDSGASEEISLADTVIAQIVTNSTATFKVATVEAGQGDTVSVDVAISQNPGILGAMLTVNYDNGLTLTNISNGEAFSELAMTLPGSFTSGCKVLWDAVSNTADADGVIMTLTFKVATDAAPGKMQIVSLLVNDLVNGNIDSIDSSVISGGVTVRAHIPGDINGDEKVNVKDVVMLMRFIAGDEVELDSDVTDVNTDGRTNVKDVVMLMRFIAGDEVALA